VAQIAGGLAVANLGDLFNIVLLAYFTPYLLKHPEALLLLPNLAAMRGAIITSMASRVSTSLHLGVMKPSTLEVLKKEIVSLVSLAMITSLYAAALSTLLSGFSVPLETTIAVIAGVIAILFLAPFASFIATFGYRLGLDPDRYLAPVLTVVGDISTAPTIVGVAMIIDKLNYNKIILFSIILSYSTVTLLYTYLKRMASYRRMIIENLIALFFVGLLEFYAGTLLVGYSKTLVYLGVMHAVPSIMEDSGAASSVSASKLSTIVHLYGFSDSFKHVPSVVMEVLGGSISGFITLSIIAYLTRGMTGSQASFKTILVIVLFGGLLLTLIFSIVGFLLIGISVYLNADPDNVVIPLLTSIVDASTIPLLIIVSRVTGLG